MSIGRYFSRHLLIEWHWYIFISAIIERLQGLHSSPERPKSSSTSCFKYCVLIKFSKFCKKDKSLVVVDLLAGPCICTWNKLIKASVISPLSFFFFNSFLILETKFKSSHRSSIKKLPLKFLEYSQENTCVWVSF